MILPTSMKRKISNLLNKTPQSLPDASTLGQGDQRIKVIHIYKDFDIHNGLIETFLLMAKEIDKKNYDFKVCVFNYKGSPFGKKFCDLGGKLDSLGASWEDNPFIIYKLYKYFKKEKPHIVQTYILKPNLYGRLAAKLAGVPVIISTELTLKNQAPTILKRIRDLFFHPLNAYLNRYTNVIICASEAIKKQWENRVVGKKLKVIYPPFDVSKLENIKALSLKEKREKNGNWVVGTVGRLSEEKRHIDLIRAFVMISNVFPKAKLVIVGNGPLKNYLEKQAKQLALEHKIIFAGFQENVFDWLMEMDIFILCSRSEGLGIAIMEAMAAGLPVVATKVGGIPEIVINNETGVLVEPEKPSELAETVIKLLTNPEKMRKMGENGRARVLTNFLPEHFVVQHDSIYKTLLSTKEITHTG